jgi:hypothetical protein
MLQPWLVGVGVGVGVGEKEREPETEGLVEGLAPDEGVGVALGVGEKEGHVSSRTVWPFWSATNTAEPSAETATPRG